MPSPVTPPSDPPRVLLINRLYPPVRASSGRLVRELARALARDGFAVTVLTTDRESHFDADGPVMVRYLVHTVPERPGLWAVMGLLIRLWLTAMRAPRPRVVITLTDPPFLAVVGDLIARLRGARHIHWVHDVYPDLLPVIGVKVPSRLYGFLYRLSRRAMNRAARVVVVGRCMARYLTQNGVDPGRVTLIPNWPELAMNPHVQMGGPLLSPMDDSLADSIAGASVMGPVPKFRVLYVGTVGYAQPIEAILDAATILESLHPEIEFIFIGGEDTQRKVNAEKARRALGNVRVLPFQPHSRLREIMESGDVHVISLRDEAGGLSVPAKFYAALSAARPVIFVGPASSEIGRVINDYGAGIVVPERGAQALAQAIIDYRLREDIWFAAHDGAMKASVAYSTEDMLRLWVRKVREAV